MEKAVHKLLLFMLLPKPNTPQFVLSIHSVLGLPDVKGHDSILIVSCYSKMVPFIPYTNSSDATCIVPSLIVSDGEVKFIGILKVLCGVVIA